MCGILGIINFTNRQSWDVQRFQQALNKMAHRGPDDADILSNQHFILGHRRLSILDLDPRSKQPMVTEDNHFVIVFNGEIYNFQALRQILCKKQVTFSTTGDTEVLLKGFRHFGQDFIHQCIGMFAFCIINKQTKTAYLYRDRLGIKPLYYASINDCFYFSSTIPSLRDLIPTPCTLNELALVSYLAFRYPIEQNTFINEINELNPGHAICLTPTTKTIEPSEYWNPIHYLEAQDQDLGKSYYHDQLLELLQSSVNYRMIADVPVGAYLSGGVDSSGLVSLMHQLNPTQQNINTYSIGFNEKNYNEFPYAQIVAQQFATQHHEIIQSDQNYYHLMKQLIHIKGAPLAVPNEVSIWELSKTLKKDITVVLSGEGADELFWGYGRLFRAPYDYQRHQQKFRWPNTTTKNNFQLKFQQQYANTTFSSQLEHFLFLYNYTSPQKIQTLLSNDINVQQHYGTLKSQFSHYFNQNETTSYGNKISYTMTKLHLPGLLQRLDNATMAASVEGRVPFVDHRLVEFSMTIPEKYKLPWKSTRNKQTSINLLANEISERHDTPKAILKNVFKNRLPHDILYRKKMGFPVPLEHWSNTTFQHIFEETLLSNAAISRGIYDTSEIKSMIHSQTKQPNNPNVMTLWMLLNIEIFLTQFL